MNLPRRVTFCLVLMSSISAACAKKHHKSSPADASAAADASSQASAQSSANGTSATGASTSQTGKETTSGTGSTSTAAQTAAAQAAAAALSAAQGNAATAASVNLPTVACTTLGATKAQVVGAVQNGVAGNYVEFQLSLIDCNGQPLSVADGQTIFFDVNGTITPLRTAPPPYTGTDSEQNPVSGMMTVVTGADLFGQVNDAFFHFETDKPFNFSNSAASVDIKISLSGQTIYPFTTPGLTTSQVQVYLRVGTSVPYIGTVQLQ